MSLVSLPSDVQRLIYSNLDRQDILSLNKTCRNTHSNVSHLVRLFINAQFNRRYGALANWEKNLPLEVVGKNIEQRVQISADLGIDAAIQTFRTQIWDDDKQKSKTKKIHRHTQQIVGQIRAHPSSVQFDKDGIPRLTEHPPTVFHHLPFGQRLRAKYYAYRSFLYQTGIANSIYAYNKDVLKELKSRPLNPESPLQDLIERQRRIKIMNDEVANLTFITIAKKSEYDDFLKTLERWERIVFKIVHLVHSLFELGFHALFKRSQFKKKLIDFAVSILPSLSESDLRQLDDFRLAQIPLCKFEMTCKSKKNTVRIETGFANNEPGKILFGFYQQDILKPLIILTVERVWQNAQGDYTESSPGPPGVLTDRQLYMNLNIQDRKALKQDPLTSDYPMLRLAVQFATELFQRESEKKLLMLSGTRRFSPRVEVVLVAGGFDPQLPAMINNIQEARKAGKLFPAYPKEPDRDYHSFRLIKSKSTLARNDNEPILVYFQLPNPTTWEALIQQNPLIPGSGPILPHHVTRDLTPFEA